MKKNPVSQSGLFTPRVLVALALCSCGILLGMFSLAATPPVEATRANTSVPPDPANFLSTSGSNANRLPPGVPLPPGTQFSLNGQGDPSSSSPTAGVPGFAGMPLRPGMASGANSLGNPVLANQQPAPLSVQRPAASESMPLAPAAAGSWSIVTSPNASAAQTTNLLYGVTCVSASDCWAVGTYYTGTLSRTLIERWNGTSWAVVASPNTSAMQTNFLYGVTCVSAADCWAVGAGYSDASTSQTLIERWDGTAWAIVTSPNAGTNQTNLLFGVTCVSASDCWAVGGYDPGPSRQTLIERWNGTTWAIVTSPNTSATDGNSLSGVTCLSASDCWAVGEVDSGFSNSQTLIERWDGTSWAIATSPATPGAQNSVLQSVTCVSASDCWAVGYTSFTGLDDRTLIERWDGTSWAIVPSPNLPAYSNRLYGVTCVSASDCWAVGREDTGNVLDPNHFQTLVERWDGTLWTIVTSPNTSATQVNFLRAVTCVSGDCWSVGYSVSNFFDQTLIERWDGTSWTIVTSDNSNNASAVPTSILYGVTCVSMADCWAVGYPTLIERWDGTSWATVTSPSAAQNNLLFGVTCVSAADCWAVGESGAGSSSSQTLIERWDGTSWAIVTSPNPTATSSSVLTDVTCVSASDCWAVGYSTASGGVILTLVERWNGTSWTIVTSPNSAQQNTLTSVTCVSASDCWAVGYAIALNDQTLVERWDGTSWAIVASPNSSATQNNFLASVTCVSASDCWAVGYFTASNFQYQTLIERWNGASWMIVSSPNTSATRTNFLKGVTCASASDCWAVGYSFAASAYQTLIERWDGTSWAIVTSPNTSATQHNILQSVTCASASNCWAVGYFIGSSGVRTLIEEFTIPVQLVSVVSRKMHGSAGTFDINLPLIGPRGIECRSGGVNGDYTLIFTFANTLTSVGGGSVTSGTGSVNSSAIGSDAHQYIVNLTGVTNAQVITVSLTGVTDSAGNFSSVVSQSMGVLVGDTTANGSVNSSDISQTKSESGNAVTGSNFREDVTVNGLVNSSDISLVKSKSGTALP